MMFCDFGLQRLDDQPVGEVLVTVSRLPVHQCGTDT